MTERYIAKFQQGKTKLHLLELTTTEEIQIFNRYLANSIGGFKLHLETGEVIPIKDEEVKTIAERYNLKKDNENYYYYKSKEDCFKTKNVKYQVRLNRKRIGTSISEYEMRKLFATYVQNIVQQLKIY